MKIAILGLLVFFSLVSARGQAERWDRRERRQKNRIEQGQDSGELTKGEQKGLKHDQRRIRHEETRAKRDGVVTGRERERLERMQDRASRRIYRDKHNERERPNGPDRGAASSPQEGN
jgi:hypothetical protein